MKNRLMFLILFLLILSIKSPAQISVTASDISSYFTIGSHYTAAADTNVTTANIGSPGSFALLYNTGFNFNYLTQSESVAPSSTLYADRYPGSTVVNKSTFTTAEGNLEVFAFYSMDASNLFVHGSASRSNFGGFTFENISNFNPLETVLKVPVNFGSSWTSDYIDSTKTFIGGFGSSVSVTHITTDYAVDGYGTIYTPDNTTLNVLRIREDRRSYSAEGGYNREISYVFLAKNGESFDVNAKDTLQPSSGTINSDYISWTRNLVTDIKDEIAAAGSYKLLSNYPNPFNPTTKLSYYLPNESSITLTVYNSLGQFVKELVKGVEPAGLHETNFNASELSSGTYIYKLNAFSIDGRQKYTSSGKMLLIK